MFKYLVIAPEICTYVHISVGFFKTIYSIAFFCEIAFFSRLNINLYHKTFTKLFDFFIII